MSWGQGYVTDIGYVSHFQNETSPIWLRTICTLQNAAVVSLNPTFLELGSGQGLSLLLLAASNPTMKFIGIDFTPSHIANSRRMADEAGLRNIEFHEASFEDLAEDPSRIPEVDIISSHGVYSWIGEAQRAAFRRIIRSRLKSGGVLYVSYNSAIGWGPIAGLQKLLRDFNNHRGGNSRSVLETIKQLQSYRDLGMPYFSQNKHLSDKLDAIAKSSPAYLAHEYLNEHWTPMYVQDVIRDMDACKLTYVGSAAPGRNVALHSVPDQFRQIVADAASVELKECLKDLILNTTFRQDVYVRGRTEDVASIWRDRIADMTLMLIKPIEDVKMEASVPRGKLQMGNPVYKQILDKMVEAPVALGKMLDDISSLHATFSLLLQTDWARPNVEHAVDPGPAKALNAVLARRSLGEQVPVSFACAKLGSGLILSPRDRWMLTTLIRNPDASAAKMLEIEQEAVSRTEIGRDLFLSAESEAPLSPDRLDAKIGKWRELDLL